MTPLTREVVWMIHCHKINATIKTIPGRISCVADCWECQKRFTAFSPKLKRVERLIQQKHREHLNSIPKGTK